MGIETDYDWVVIDEDADDPSMTIHHATVDFTAQGEVSTKTVCGLDLPNPDEEWRWSTTLGNHRPCDNCTRIIAQR